MYNPQEILSLVQFAERIKLKMPSELGDAPISQLQIICNGIGADWMSAKSRRVITRLLSYAEASAMIHDWQYHHSDGDELTRSLVDEDFLHNALREVRSKHPQWWNIRRILGERAILAAHEVLCRTGGIAWNDAFANRVKRKLQSLNISTNQFFNLAEIK